MTKIAIIFFQYSNLMFVLYNLLAHNLTLILCVEWTLNNVHIYMCNNTTTVDSFVRFFYSFFTDICVGFVWAKIYEHCISLKERINSMYVCMYILYYMMYHWKGSTLTDSNVLCFRIFSCDFLPHWNGNATQQPYDVMALTIWY